MNTRSARTTAAAFVAVCLLASAAHAAAESSTAAAPELGNAFVRVKEGDDIDTVVHTGAVAMWRLAKQKPQAKLMCLDVVVSKGRAVDQYGNPMKKDRRRVGHIVEPDLDEIRKYRTEEYFLKSPFSGKYARILDMQRTGGVLEPECEADKERARENSPALTTYLDAVRNRIKSKWLYPPEPAGVASRAKC